MVGQGKAQAKWLSDQALMQPLCLGLRFFWRAFYSKARTFELDIEILLTEPGQRQRDAIVVVIAFFDVVRRKTLLFSGALQSVSQFVKANPLTQQRG
ncbi:hypothetical protein D3C86_1668900 [compost metagenome]